jgi:uncharacterized protein YbaP (TraB family)
MLRSTIFTFFLLLFSFQLSAQKKYQGLLWEITGNGLNEPSYLYGTMHVSNKLAFNVSDSFYYCLDKVDGIALESSPQTWMEEFRGPGSPSGNMFGSSFYEKAIDIKEPEVESFYELLEIKNRLVNQILYRFNPGDADYQEDTYLDMFIFQAGAKNNKPIHSLETFEEVMELSVKSMTPDKEKKRDNNSNSYLDKKKKKRFLLLEEAYRRGDLDQIDSLSKANTPTSVYHKYFIVERNKNMVRRMDSIMHDHSIFTGIGAAHLPGDEGAIQLLRDMGYTVRAVSPKSTSKSHKMRKKFENLYRPIEFTETVTPDKFISVKTPGFLYEMPSRKKGIMEYLCPEPVNGGNFSIYRLFTLGPIYNKGPEYYRTTFDSLLYIATPGEIIKKEEIEVNGHSGINVLSKTSKDNYVQYRIFFTPTEIIVFKGSGINNYIQKPEPQSFFTKVKLERAHGEWKSISPLCGGASWEMKGMTSGQDMIEGMEQQRVDPFYQSYDNESKDYYQVIRYTYQDLTYLEEDSFDLAFLGKSYADQFGYDLVSTTFDQNDGYAFVEQVLAVDKNHKGQVEKIYLKILTKANTFYIMATTSQANKRRFFDSFSFTDVSFDYEYEEYKDTTLHYTVNTIRKEEKPKYQNYNYGYYGYDEDEEDKSYLGKTLKKRHYNPATGESVYVQYTKFHDYAGADSIEAFWDYRTERLTKKNHLKVSRLQDGEENGDMTLSFLLTDTGSAKGVLTKFRLHHGVLYSLQSLIDTTEGPSAYVQGFFDSFEPKDTLIGRDLFEDKAVVFFEHVNGEDSLSKVNAMKSINQVDFEEKDVKNIVETYYGFDFDEEKEDEQKEDLLLGLGNIETQEAYDFLYAVYDSNNFNSARQFVVLRSFSYTETEEAYKAIKRLLIDNTPFSEKKNKLNFFDNLYDSLELAKVFFPEMIDLTQYSEYQPYVMELLAWGYLDSVFTFSDFSTQKKSIYRNATIELKRTVANQKDKKNKNSYYYRSSHLSAYHSLFLDYYTLMCGFKANGHKDADNFFKDIYRIENEKFIIEAEIIHHKLGMKVDTAKINEVLRDTSYRAWTYNRMDEEEMLNYFPGHINQEDMAFSVLYSSGYNNEEDTVAFIRKVKVNTGKEEGYVYFYKRKTEKTKNWMVDYVGIMPLEETAFKVDDVKSKRGLSVRNEEEIEKTIERTIEIFELQDRKRVNLDGYDYGNWLY